MVLFGIAVVYLALAAWFYLYLMRTATNVSLPTRPRPHKWQRTRRLPKRSRKN